MKSVLIKNHNQYIKEVDDSKAKEALTRLNALLNDKDCESPEKVGKLRIQYVSKSTTYERTPTEIQRN